MGAGSGAHPLWSPGRHRGELQAHLLLSWGGRERLRQPDPRGETQPPRLGQVLLLLQPLWAIWLQPYLVKKPLRQSLGKGAESSGNTNLPPP